MVVRTPLRRRLAAVRLALVAALVATGAVVLTSQASSAKPEPALRATPAAKCGPGSRPETDIQGRVPKADYTSGRAAQGYRCNTKLVGKEGHAGGYKVFRYVDKRGNRCAFYDSTLLFGKDLLFGPTNETGFGVKVLDMSRPKKPRVATTLKTPTMLNPHESLVLNNKRGLLAAVLGSPLTAPGIVEIWDVKDNCLKPVRKSTTVSSLFGHESGFAPDGKTLYITGTGGPTWTALDVTNPAKPKVVHQQVGDRFHGLRLSPDGRTMYAANTGIPGQDGTMDDGGLQILDVSGIQDRRTDKKPKLLSSLAWPVSSISQHADPLVIKGRKYLLQIDEFADIKVDLDTLLGVGYNAKADVGAARLIDIQNPRRPKVVSNLRLAVNNADARKGPSQYDPGARLPVQGYAGHYCSAPKRKNPGIVACSFIASGLRVFDVRNPAKPREVAYFNQPSLESNPLRSGAWAMSAPAWDLKRKQVWYSDGNSGFYAVKLTNGVVPKKYLR